MKKTMLTIIYSFFLSLTVFSQNEKKLDSLLITLNNQKEDTLKVKTLHALFDIYMYKDSKKCLKYAIEELELSKKINYKAGIGKGNLHIGMAYYFLGNIDSTRVRFKNASKIFDEIEDYFLVATVTRNLSILEYENGNYDAALPLLNKTVDIYKNKLKDSVGVALAYETISKVHIFKGNFKIAMQYGIKSLKILETKNNPIYLAHSLNNLGIIESYNSQFNESINHNLQALKIYTENDEKWWSAQVYNDLGNNYYDLKQFDKAISYLNKSIKLARNVNAKYIECTALGCIGKVYLALNKSDIAFNSFMKSIEIGEDLKLRNKNAETQNHLGELFSKKGQNHKAIKYFDMAIQTADSIGAKDNLKNILYNRSLSYANLGYYKKAFKDLESLRILNDSIYNQTKSQQIEELKTIYETEKKEAEIALQQKEIKTLNQEVEISNLRKGLYAGGMISFVALSGLLYFGFKQREKKNRIAREKQDAIYKQEIAFKKKELASETLHLVQKNTFINELKENLERIKQSPELFKVEFRRLVMLLKKESAEDKDWEVFKSYFSEVHNNFDNKIKAIAEDISEKEIRLASFLRMNLSTKEIASMLNVLPESVLKSKYRLKKKLKLDKEIDLNHFLNDL